jgi:exopolyphosphatase/guanosine-5'-triphosphate,3'-diphosphate pyrophosphatase
MSPTAAASPATSPREAQTIAAVDLGSNSFHMIIAEVDDAGHVYVVDRLREQVRLAAGLGEDGTLDPAAMERGIACLERFGQRLSVLPRGRVRAVGTNTLRSAHNGGEFLTAARRALGHPIEVIAGREEARLIYLGVAHTLADDSGRRLVMDIGGGSTEFIIGERFEAKHRESLYMGCVSGTQRYFGDGKVSESAMGEAEIAARLELQSIERRYRRIGWVDAIGASGTIKAVRTVLEANGWSDDGITRKGLEKLRKALIKARLMASSSK